MNIDKQVLREEFRFMQVHYSDPADRARQVIYIAAEALLDELETKEEQRANWFQMAQKLGEDLDAAEKRNAEQQRSLDHRKFLLLSADKVQRDFAEALGCAGDNESIMEAIDDLKQHIAELESKNSNLRTIAHEQNELAIRANLDSINDAVEMDRLHKRIAELEAREISLPERSSMLYRTDFHEDCRVNT
ncbi:TPA: ead/Ea22-like family protein [Salmonella enterica subsp. houtenae serovar [1],40:z4,z23:-]|nr:ead/Ea22-like family protein [Salmonella enterica]